MKSLGYYDTDFMPCEITESRGVDVHHIVNRDNRIENLMLLTREKHQEYGEIKSKMFFLLEMHMNFLDLNGVKYDYNWFKEQMNKYEVYKDD